ncbi:MAG TPA: DoxX family protein, partial [Flavisolibacter sp.]|nr:DoxX family protein [Flavisolibacter sp.]
MKKFFSTRVSETNLSIGLFILRIGAGFLMLANHGYGKLAGFAEKSQNFKINFLGIGTTASFSLVVFAEFFCAAFIILGLFTRLAVIPLIIAMSVALFVANKGKIVGPGELAGIFLACYIVLFFTGPGKLSVDRFLF